MRKYIILLLLVSIQANIVWAQGSNCTHYDIQKPINETGTLTTHGMIKPEFNIPGKCVHLSLSADTTRFYQSYLFKPSSEYLVKELQKSKNLKIESHQLNVYGLCEFCE